MKILMVVDSFYPESIGGSENVIYNVSKNLVKQGNEVVILTGVRNRITKNLLEYEDMECIKIFRYPDYHRTFGFLYIPSILNCIRAFKKVSKDYKFDIIHFHHALSSFAINLTEESKKIKKVYHFHGPANKEFEADLFYRKSEFNFLKKLFLPLWSKLKSNLLKYIEGYSLEKVDRIITLSNYMKMNLVDIHKYPLNKVEIIPAGVDLNKFHPLDDKLKIRKKLNIPENANVILTVRRLVGRMGVDNLILAFPDIIKFNADFFLIIVGDGEMKKYLETLVNKLKIQDFVLFTGFVKNDNILPYYQASDLFILPSITLEGFGLVILESLASGVPVLATKIGGAPEEIIGKFKKEFLIGDAKPETISKAIIEFFKYKKDYKDECRKFVIDNFSWDISTDKIVKVYQSMGTVPLFQGKRGLSPYSNNLW